MSRPVFSPTALLATALAVGAALAAPGLAGATTIVSRSGNTLTITGDAADSRLTHDSYYTGFQVQDDLPNASVLPGPGCNRVSDVSVECGAYPAGDTYGAATSLTANLGGGNDAYKYAIYGGPQTVNGEGGNDAIEASNGKDVVNGGPGNDDLNGGRGDDTLDGGEGDDVVDGWDGSDTVTGGPGADKLFGDGLTIYAGGSDTIFARDGEGDQVDCGGGADRAEVDALDTVASCATVDRPSTGTGPTPTPTPIPGGPTPTPTPGPAGPGTELTVDGVITKKQTIPALAKGKAVTVTVTPTLACTGKVQIAVSKAEAKRLRLGTKVVTLVTSKPISFPAATATKVNLAIGSKYRGKVGKAKALKASVAISCTTSEGKTSRRALTVNFKK